MNRLDLFDIHISLIPVLRLKAYTFYQSHKHNLFKHIHMYSYFIYTTCIIINLTNLLSYVILLKKKEVFNNLNRRCEIKFDFWQNVMV